MRPENVEHNLSVNRMPGKLRLPLQSALRAPVAGYLRCYTAMTLVAAA